MSQNLSDDKRFFSDPIVPMEKPFADARGAIQPISDEPVGSCVLISSKKGAIRANHYHKADWHYCYVTSGSIDYYFRPVGDKNPPKHVRIKTGQIFFTPPLIEHAMCFPEDTVSFASAGTRATRRPTKPTLSVWMLSPRTIRNELSPS